MQPHAVCVVCVFIPSLLHLQVYDVDQISPLATVYIVPFTPSPPHIGDVVSIMKYISEFLIPQSDWSVIYTYTAAQSLGASWGACGLNKLGASMVGFETKCRSTEHGWWEGLPQNEVALVPGSPLKNGRATSFPVGGESLGMRFVPGHVSILHFTSLL